jgi:hypothetical protein
MRTKLTVVIKENKSKEPQQLDEIWGNILHSYKWLGPLHDILNMSDPEDKGLFKGILKWYQNNETTQTLGNMVASFEKLMNKAWESGAAGKSAALTVQGLLSGGDVVTSQISAGVGYILRLQRDEMVAEKLAIAEKAAAEIQAAKKKAEKESQGAIAIAKVPDLEAIINQLKADLRQKDIERAKQLFAASEDLKEKTKLLPPSQLTRGSQEKMYKPPVKEGKKMTKKYSSFKQQQMLTENFRKFIGEIRVEDQIGPPGALELTAEKVASTRGLEGDQGKGYASMIKRSSKYPLESLKDQAKDPMAPSEWKAGAELAITDIEKWLKSDKKKSLMNWVIANTTDGEIDYGQLQESKKAKKVTKSQLTKIIAEEIKKTLSEAGEIPPRPEGMPPERYAQLVAPEKARRAKEDEESAAAGLAKAEELEQEFLNDPKIADLLDLGAKTKVNAGGLWVGLPSRSKTGKVSTDGPNTAGEIDSKLIYSDWSTTSDITRSGWVKVVKRRKEKPWTDPDPHGRYVPGENAPRLSPWEE